MNIRRTLFALIALAALPPTAALGGPPLPEDSIVDPCLAVCPAGDIRFRVEARRLGHPEGGWPVDVNLCACPTVHMVPADGTEPYGYYSPCDVVIYNDAITGIADFYIRAGGTCSGSSIPVTAVFVLATRTAVASPDQDGDLQVNAYDLALATAKLGTSDPTADFNCDGTVTQADLTLLSAHLGHKWQGGATPAHASTWGRVKTIYR